ncbi:hypothetical protein IFM89_030182 [Coptis chinensis]|uniref:Uncharacterized protein n=1 Tax=Coptis chinensis TaxID=261450 RepID=A0A835LF08_9MAGN|nr:hypothetical protein IFM89_030182 [Coptis chinensis]
MSNRVLGCNAGFCYWIYTLTYSGGL